MNKECADCNNCGCDPDGLYCGHEFAMKASQGFGLGLRPARTEENCGKEAKYFEIAPDSILIARGRK